MSPRQITWIGFDDERFEGMQTSDFNSILEAYMEMFPDIPIKDVYFFFDEIQRIEGWELFVMRLSKHYSKHIFISGSNADMLSEELNTALRGWPLEYKEYIFLLYKVTKFDLSFKKETSALPKYYCVDNGLRQSVLLPGKDDDGILFENAVFLQLLRNLPDGQKICYYLGDKECDFVIQTETAVNQLIQVCWDMKDKDTRERELNGIREAATLTGCRDLTIVTRDMEEDVQDALGIIHIVPAWKWFLGR